LNYLQFLKKDENPSKKWKQRVLNNNKTTTLASFVLPQYDFVWNLILQMDLKSSTVETF